ncbi:MAG: hypothetical protein AB7O68_13495 [Pirellulales bacterium]
MQRRGGMTSMHGKLPRLRPVFSLRTLVLAIALAACVFGLPQGKPPWELGFTIKGDFSDASFSPDRRMLAATYRWEPQLMVCDARSGKELYLLGDRLLSRHGGAASQRTCFLDSNSLVFLCGEKGELQLWDLTAKRLLDQADLGVIEGFCAKTGRAVTHPAGDQSNDVWDLTTTKSLLRRQKVDVGDHAYWATFSDDGSSLLVQTRNQFAWVPLESDAPIEYFDIRRKPDYRGHVSIAPKHDRFVACDSSGAYLYERGRLQTVRKLTTSACQQSAFSPDSRQLAIAQSGNGASRAGGIQIVGLDSGRSLFVDRGAIVLASSSIVRGPEY